MIPRGRLNTRLTIERQTADSSFDGAGRETWTPVGKVWAEVQDVLPSRAERQDDGFTVTTWRARVRMDFRRDIDGSMRFVSRDRKMQVVSGPAELGRRNGIEFMVEEWTPKGGAA